MTGATMKPLTCRSDVRASADASFDRTHANQAADGRLQDLSLDPGAHALEPRQCERRRVGVAAAQWLFPDLQVVAHEDDDRTPSLRRV